MANELTILTRITTANGYQNDSFNPASIQVTQAALGGEFGYQIIGTSAEPVTVGDVSTLGYCGFQNVDSTNYIDIGPDSTGLVGFMRLEPGDVAVFRLKPGITIKAQANTASCKLRKFILED